MFDRAKAYEFHYKFPTKGGLRVCNKRLPTQEQRNQRNPIFLRVRVAGVSDVKSKTMESIRSGLRHIMSDFLQKQSPDEAAVLAWPVVCGAEVASRTKAVSFADGRLIVEVPDANWRNQLSAFTPRYLSSLNELLGSRMVSELRFVVCDLKRPSPAGKSEIKNQKS